MTEIHTSIEITAAPSVVREKFLDFSRLSEYHNNKFFKSIGPKTPGEALEPGIKLKAVFTEMEFEPTLLENSPSCFKWVGVGLLGTFTGEHYFRFEPSTTTPGGTTFRHGENFSGLSSFLMGDGVVARSIGFKEKTTNNFKAYNEDLKKWCEGH